MQKPSLGRIVLVHGYLSNGAMEQPAVITRVWTDTCINVMVLPDANAPASITSVLYDGDTAKTTKYSWRWPPRVDA